MARHISSKTVVIDGQEYEVKVFAPRKPRDGRDAAIDGQMDPQVRREMMADYSHATGHSPLSEPHSQWSDDSGHITLPYALVGIAAYMVYWMISHGVFQALTALQAGR